MKNMIALFLTVAALFTGSSLNAIAQKPQSFDVAESGGTAVAEATEATAENASISRYTVSANAVRYHTYRMVAGENIKIELSGDGDSDLDLYVYSSDGRLIASGESYSDFETSYIAAHRSGMITIKVVNRGVVYNNYNLSVF